MKYLKGNSEELEKLYSMEGNYYKDVLLIAEKLAVVREIKVVDLQGIILSYRGTRDDTSVIYNTRKGLVKVYKFIEGNHTLVLDGVSLPFESRHPSLVDSLLSYDRKYC